MNDKGEEWIKSLDGRLIPTDYKTIGSVNDMLWTSVKEHSRRSEFFARYMSDKDSTENLFKDFLPFRFKVKKFLNKIGLFEMARAIISMKKIK